MKTFLLEFLWNVGTVYVACNIVGVALCRAFLLCFLSSILKSIFHFVFQSLTFLVPANAEDNLCCFVCPQGEDEAEFMEYRKRLKLVLNNLVQLVCVHVVTASVSVMSLACHCHSMSYRCHVSIMSWLCRRYVSVMSVLY